MRKVIAEKQNDGTSHTYSTWNLTFDDGTVVKSIKCHPYNSKYEHIAFNPKIHKFPFEWTRRDGSLQRYVLHKHNNIAYPWNGETVDANKSLAGLF